MAAIERNEMFELAYCFITETQESIFLTGKAGTGKTTFLKYLKDNCSKNIVVVAPTGVAAINAGGVTLHSLFQLPLHPFLPTEKNRQHLLQGIRYNKQRINLLRKIELLVIDEISMVRCDVLDAIDCILKSVRRNRDAAFGGVQLLFIGDLFQLPPVAKNEEWKMLNEYYASPFFFDSKTVKEQPPLLIELTTIYRQKEERFVTLLNKVRNNRMDKDDYEHLNQRYIQHFQPATEEKYITLTSHNNQADHINQAKLQQLNTRSYTYKAKIEGEFPENIYPAEAALVLKEGTQVMFIKNDAVTRQYFNGKIGVVSLLTNEKIIVDCDGHDIEVHQEVWDNVRYTLNRTDEKLEQQVVGQFFQFPLRLAWAITIHKSQGLTFDKVMIDAAAAFSSGQVYVALSRCTSLEGIVLLSKIPPTAIYSNEQVVAAHASLVPKGSLAERFQGARQVFTVQLLSEIFLLEDIGRLFNWLKTVVEKNNDKLNAEALTWIYHFGEQLKREKTFAEKFLTYIPSFLQQEPVIEKNLPLQKRVQDAAGYFLPLLLQLKQQLQQHPLLCEHKEVAADIDEALLELMAALIKTIHQIQYCTALFIVADYLKHKLNIAIPRIYISSYAAKKQTVALDIPNAELFYTLKTWRDKVCTDEDIPIYLVANNNSLKEVATYLPLTSQHLQQLNGYGKAKAEKYGDVIIAMVQSYCDKYNFPSNIELKTETPKRKRKESVAKKEDKIPSAIISLQLLQQGKTMETIAAERNLAISTVEGHLISLVKIGEVNVEVFAGENAVKIITACINSNPDKPHSEIKSLLNDAYTYTQIRAVANHLLWLRDKTIAAQLSDLTD